MKVLFLCNKSPYPPKEGGPIAMNALIEGMADAGHKVKVLAINSNKYGVDVKNIPETYRKKTNIETVYINLAIKPLDAFFNLFTKKSYHVQRFISKDFEKALIRILSKDDYDIVQFETLFITPYIPVIRKHSNALIILRSHNIEHLIWKRVAEITKNPLKKLYLGHIWKTLRDYEVGHLNKYDGIVTITKIDGDFFQSRGCTIPLTDIPFGISLEKFNREQKISTEFPSLFHIGAMNWMPNIEGVKWFLDYVWPKVHQAYPDLKFYLAGREMPDWLTNLKLKNVEVVGEVDDALDFIDSKAIEIVPLFSGSGIRIKIIEGMAMGKAVISTSIGAEGIHVESGKNIMLADNADAFFEAVKKCVEDEKHCKKLGENAMALIRRDHDNEKLIKKLEEFYNSILSPR
jgi:glycosyltransferase involved in cell wall biosynthesis